MWFKRWAHSESAYIPAQAGAHLHLGREWSKVPYSIAQHVGHSGARTRKPMIASPAPLSTAPHVPTIPYKQKQKKHKTNSTKTKL